MKPVRTPIEWSGWCVLWDVLDDEGARRMVEPGFETERVARAWVASNLDQALIQNIQVLHSSKMTPAPVVTVVRGDGWDAIYVDGVLRGENDSIGVVDLRELDFFKSLIDHRYADPDWLRANESYPKLLGDVQFYEVSR